MNSKKTITSLIGLSIIFFIILTFSITSYNYKNLIYNKGVENTKLKILYIKDLVSNKYNDPSLTDKSLNNEDFKNFINNILDKDDKIIIKNKNRVIFTNTNSKNLNNNFIIKDLNIFIYYSFNNNVKFINPQNLMSVLLLIIVGLIFSIYFSNKITKPIADANRSIRRLIEQSSHFKNNLFKHKELFSHDHSIYKLSDTTNLVVENIEDYNFDKYTKEIEKYYENSSKFISKLSHDLRTPLTLIKGYAKGMKLDEDSKNQRYLKNILHSVLDIENIIYNELDLSFDVNSEYYLNKTKINLNNFIKEVKDDISEICTNKNREVKFNKISLNHFAYFDKSSIKRVIDNVVNNSLKYSKKEIEINFILKNNFLKISIIDYGMGISNDDLKHIQKIFYQGTNNKEEGYGLGLYISSTILEAHNFKYEINTEENIGTKFSFYINLIV